VLGVGTVQLCSQRGHLTPERCHQQCPNRVSTAFQPRFNRAATSQQPTQFFAMVRALGRTAQL
jgi:hypothetical protein